MIIIGGVNFSIQKMCYQGGGGPSLDSTCHTFFLVSKVNPENSLAHSCLCQATSQCSCCLPLGPSKLRDSMGSPNNAVCLHFGNVEI